MSDFTSNLRRSKSFKYSMARGLGGREGMGREGEDMLSDGTAGASTGFFCVSGLLESPRLGPRVAHRQQQWCCQEVSWLVSVLCDERCVPESLSLFPLACRKDGKKTVLMQRQ